MSKSLYLTVLCVFLCVAGSAHANDPAEAENSYLLESGLSCDYSGQRTGGGVAGALSWQGFWFQGDGAWIFRGNGKDAQGQSQLQGACAEGQCEFGQTYVTGKKRGKGFTYRYSYKAALPDEGPIQLAFSGRWSLGDSYRNNTGWTFRPVGGWQVKPRCRALEHSVDLKKLLGWNPW